jgi:hypothetical protein
MKAVQILPTLLIVIDILSAIGYACGGDMRKVIYWLAAAALTAAVTF